MREKIVKTFRALLSRIFVPAYKVLITPEKIILFERKFAPIFFEGLDDLLSYLQEKRRSFLLYTAGFEQEVITETCPSLRRLERDSYLRHRVELLREKASLILMKISSSKATYLLQNCDFLGRFREVSPFLRAIRSLSLEMAVQFQTPTLCRLVLSDRREVLIYGSHQTLNLTRSIQGKDVEAYDKTLRYIERQFHQSESNIRFENWTLEEVQKFIWMEEGNFSGTKVVSRENFNGPFYGRLGLKFSVGIMTAVSIFLGAVLYQGWNEKEALQQDVFVLKNNLDQIHIPKRQEPSLSPAALDHFEKVLKERSVPLENLELLAPVNSEVSSLKGLVWRCSNHGDKAQVVFEICSSKKGRNNFAEWVRDTLLSKSSSLDILVRDEDQNDEMFETEEERQVCLVTEVSSFERSLKDISISSDARKEENDERN